MKFWCQLAFLFLILLPGIASAGDEQQINSQLQQGGLVHLQPITYTITNSIILQSDTTLEGEPGTIIKLTDNAGWKTWTPLVSGIGVKNVIIRGIEFDVNADNQQNAPTWKGHSGSGSPKNWGMGNYNIIHVIDCDNIEVSNCLMHDGLGDGFRVKTSTNIKFYNNTVYKLGHDVFYGIDSQNIQAYNNRITTRTNSALRLWNTEHVRLYNNVIDAQLDSLGGNPGIQIEDSKGTMQDIEVCNNILTKTWGAGIWLIAYEKGVLNNQGILIHHNLFNEVGQSYNIQYTSGIANDGIKGTQVYNNVFDGARNDAFRNQEGGQGTAIHDNIITNTVPHTGISQAGTGSGIADLAGAGLSIVSNCFYNNQNGNLFKTVSSSDDLQDPKTHNTSSGWWWTGTTWACAFVAPMDLGTIAPTTTRNTTDTDTHEFNDIFDILDTTLSDSGYVNQSSVFLPDKTLMSKGTESAWLDVVGYTGEIKIGNDTYIPKPASESAIVVSGTQSTRDRVVSQASSKKLTVSANNSLVVDLEVKTTYEVPQKNKITIFGKSLNYTTYRKISENTTFTKTFKASVLFPVFNPPNVSVVNFNGSHAIVTIPDLPGIVKIDYTYDNSTATEYRLIGYVGSATNGFKSTEYKVTTNYLFDNSGMMSQGIDGLYIKDRKFNLSKLNVTVITPYDSFHISHFGYTVVEDDHLKFFKWGFVGILGYFFIFGRVVLLQK